MGELTARIIKRIDEAKEFSDFKDWIWMAGDLLRKSQGPGFYSGFKEIDEEEVTQEEGKQIREAALRALSRNSELAYLGSLLSVLRDSCDPDLLPFWVENLAKYLALLKGSNGIVYTILLALKDINEPVFENAKSLCVVDIERNVKEAFDYLRKHGIVVPG
jgi:hypothetical protein